MNECRVAQKGGQASGIKVSKVVKVRNIFWMPNGCSQHHVPLAPTHNLETMASTCVRRAGAFKQTCLDMRLVNPTLSLIRIASNSTSLRLGRASALHGRQ